MSSNPPTLSDLEGFTLEPDDTKEPEILQTRQTRRALAAKHRDRDCSGAVHKALLNLWSFRMIIDIQFNWSVLGLTLNAFGAEVKSCLRESAHALQ